MKVRHEIYPQGWQRGDPPAEIREIDAEDPEGPTVDDLIDPVVDQVAGILRARGLEDLDVLEASELHSRLKHLVTRGQG